MTFSLIPFSASINGRGILVAATADPGTLIHTAIAGVGQIDEIILSATNIDTVDRLLTLEHGSNTSADLLPYTVPAGATISLNRLFLQNGLALKAYAAAANKIILTGSILRGP